MHPAVLLPASWPGVRRRPMLAPGWPAAGQLRRQGPGELDRLARSARGRGGVGDMSQEQENWAKALAIALIMVGVSWGADLLIAPDVMGGTKRDFVIAFIAALTVSRLGRWRDE